MSTHFTAKAQNTLKNAQRFASEMGHTYIGSEHILLALAAEADSVASKLLLAHNLTVDRIKEEIASVSAELAEKLLEREVNTNDHTKMIEAFLDEVGDAT